MNEGGFEGLKAIALVIVIFLVPAIGLYYCYTKGTEERKSTNTLHIERYGWEKLHSCEEVDRNNGFCWPCEQKKVFLNASDEVKLKMLEIQVQKDLGKSIEQAGKQVGNDIFWSRFLFGN